MKIKGVYVASGLLLFSLAGCTFVRSPDAFAVSCFQSIDGLSVSITDTNGTRREWRVDKLSGDTAMAEAVARGAAQGATRGRP